MEIVANKDMLRNFMKQKEFKMDLGESLTKTENEGDGDKPNFRTVIKITDPFSKKYHSMYGNYLYKYGTFGKIVLYVDYDYQDNLFTLFDYEKMYDITYDETKDFRTFLTETFKNISDQKLESQKLESVEITEEPKQKHMTQEQLIEHLLNSRK
jgi:hypothetical protein